MLNVQGKDLNDLFDKSMDTLMNNPSTWDAEQTPRILSYNNLLFSDSTNFTFDLSTVGFTKTRWARYCNQYLDKESLTEWFDILNSISKRGENLFRSKDAIRRAREHHHGSCWLGLSYRGTPPTLVLYSRVAEFPTRAALELTLASKVGAEIKAKLQLPGEIKFVWFVSSLFLSCLHLLPYLAHRGKLEETYLRKDSVGHFVRHQVDHINRGNVKYGPTKRMAKRLQQYNDGVTVPVPIESLSLWR